MLQALIIDQQPSTNEALRQRLLNLCPVLEIETMTDTLAEVSAPLAEANLVFLDTNLLTCERVRQMVNQRRKDCQIICLGDSEKDAFRAFQIKATNFLKRPYQDQDLLTALNDILVKMNSQLKKQTTKVKVPALIGIPTLEEISYIPVDQIIKCEGLQKCTRVVLQNQPNLVSSYNIGEFIKLLSPYGFYATHKSHLINLQHVKKYLREGTIILSEQQKAPLARRRKAAFMALIPHL